MITILRIFPVFCFLQELCNRLSHLLLEKAYHISRFREMQTESYSLYRKSRKQQIIFYFLQQRLFQQMGLPKFQTPRPQPYPVKHDSLPLSQHNRLHVPSENVLLQQLFILIGTAIQRQSRRVN